MFFFFQKVVVFLCNDLLIVGRAKTFRAVQNLANAIATNEIRFDNFVQVRNIIALFRCQVRESAVKLVRSLEVCHGPELSKTIEFVSI